MGQEFTSLTGLAKAAVASAAMVMKMAESCMLCEEY